MTTTFSPNQATGPCVVEQAIIETVNPETHSATVQCIYSHRSIPDVKIASPFLSYKTRGGLRFLPDPGSLCYVFTPADGSGSFIFGYCDLGKTRDYPQRDGSLEAQTDYRGEYPPLDPGDMHLGSVDDNFLILKRGGILQLGATQLAQRMYIPIENLVRDYFQRYHGFSPLGEIVWDHVNLYQDNVDPKTADVPVIVKLSCREKINHKKMTVEIRMGRLDKDTLEGAINENLLNEGKKQSVEVITSGQKIEIETKTLDMGDGSGDLEHLMAAAKKEDGLNMPVDHEAHPGVVSIAIRPDDGDTVVYSFQIDKQGNNFIHTDAHMHIECAKGFFLQVDDSDGYKVQSGSNKHIELNSLFRAAVKEALLEILETGDVNIKGLNINLEAKGVLTLAAQQLVLTSPGGGGGSMGEVNLNTKLLKIGPNPVSDLLIDATQALTALELHQHNGVGGTPAIPLPTTKLPIPPASFVIPGARTSASTSTKILVTP